jgi:hypothetical protein
MGLSQKCQAVRLPYNGRTSADTGSDCKLWRYVLRYTYVGNVNQNVRVAILYLIVGVTERTVYPGKDE